MSKMRTLAWQKLPAHIVQRQGKCVWARVMSLDEIQPDFEMEEELFCQKKVSPKKDEKKKAPKEVTKIKIKFISNNHLQ
jgi:hypothetical protein